MVEHLGKWMFVLFCMFEALKIRFGIHQQMLSILEQVLELIVYVRFVFIVLPCVVFKVSCK